MMWKLCLGMLVVAGQAMAVPVEIDAATLEVLHPQGKATFGGGVVVTQGDTVLRAPTVVVTYGKGGKGDVEEIVTQGRTRVVRGSGEKAEADSATYVPQSEKLVLRGNVVLTQQGNTLRGATLTYDLKSGKITLGGGGGVRGSFENK